MTAPYICLNCRRTCLRALQFRRPFSSCPRILHDSNSSAITRPPTGPKPVPNVKHIRENAELYSQNCIDRNYRSLSEYPSRIKTLADEAAQLQRSLNAPRSKIKQVQRAIAKLATSSTEGKGKASGKNEELDALHLEAKQLKHASQSMTDRREKCLEEVQQLALSLPNLTSKETPRGDIPRVVNYINYDPRSPPGFVSSPEPTRNHVSIGTSLGLLDFTSSATSTGWGWYYLTNEGALLEQALVQYALSVAMRRGWKPVSPPTLVYSYIAEACGFQPRDVNNEQQIWSIEQNEKDKSKPQRCLTGTAEIPLAAMYAGQEIPADKLPLKFIGISRCYRAEAGARGVDTKGLYRVHEFTKVELFGWADDIPEANSKSATTTTTTTTTSSSSSSTLFSEMLSIQTEILSSLNLPCRILEMPTADLGASAARKQDIETLFPSRLHHTLTQQPSQAEPFDHNGWGEVTSASICTDYQSRRLGTRVRTGAAARFPHTVNGTAVAVPRVLAAILENGWDEKRGVVIVPEVLRNWMGGIETIGGREGMVE
uniref:serine--tRNA ligase n=1 Tax=Coccidioides posadasii RMSCC 3488 TaxID=454284 RepID=A0A0J6FUF5_COCPO|nr:seryl-tRNA synthetase [Coccidioides posadasii RMSCC 3488]